MCEWSRYTEDEKQSLARGLQTVLREGGAPDAEAFLARGDEGVLIEVPAPPYEGVVDRYGRAPVKVRNAWADGAVRGIRLLAERVGIDLICHGEHSKYGAGHGFHPLPDSGFVHITVPWAGADHLLAALAGVAPIVPAEDRGASGRCSRGVARLRQPDRGRRPQRGRARTGARFRRRHRRPLSARRVGARGKAYGLDMTEEMLALALANAAKASATNVEFLKGTVEATPLPAGTIDVVISNCVINLSIDKQAMFTETFRVLKPGGRIGVSDVVADDHLTSGQRAVRGDYVGCIAGALSFTEYRQALEAAGFTGVSIRPTHQVADGMHSAIVKATKPATAPVGATAGAALPLAQDSSGCCS